MAKLTAAQRWALQAIADRYDTPSYLGGRMMERPGVEEKRRGGNRNSHQGLGRIGGTMIQRLKRMGLVSTRNYTPSGQWHTTRASITEAGRLALQDGEGR